LREAVRLHGEGMSIEAIARELIPKPIGIAFGNYDVRLSSWCKA
jgi:hypothetical protein